MIKQLFFASLLILTHAIESSNRCLGYTGRRFRRHAIEPVVCDCDCQAQYHVRCDDKKGYGCIRCGHKLLPYNPLEQQSKPNMFKKRTCTVKKKRKNK